MPTNNNATTTPLVENGQYGPTITLNPGSKWPFRFGPSKAKLIVDSIDSIRAFLENHPPQERERGSRRSRPTRNERIIDHGHDNYAREEGHHD